MVFEGLLCAAALPLVTWTSPALPALPGQAGWVLVWVTDFAVVVAVVAVVAVVGG